MLNNLTICRNPVGSKNDNIDIDDHRYWSTKMIHLNSANENEFRLFGSSFLLWFGLVAVARSFRKSSSHRNTINSKFIQSINLNSFSRIHAIWIKHWVWQKFINIFIHTTVTFDGWWISAALVPDVNRSLKLSNFASKMSNVKSLNCVKMRIMKRSRDRSKIPTMSDIVIGISKSLTRLSLCAILDEEHHWILIQVPHRN